MDRPILFSGPMVRALLAGRKFQTRRIIDFVGIDKVVDFVRVAFDKDTGVPIYEMKDSAGQFVTRPKGKHFVDYHYSPRFAVGDRLWVRESLRVTENDQGIRWLTYAADGKDVWPTTQWHKDRNNVPSIHMPRWASRVTLSISDIRIERLQSISHEDALAEGIVQYGRFYGLEGADWDDAFRDPREAFGKLWADVNGAGSWYANPWVVAATFATELSR